MTCETCPFFHRYTGDSVAGECRRNPPVWDKESRAEFPETRASAWCGEHPERAALAGKMSTDVVMRVINDSLMMEFRKP